MSCAILAKATAGSATVYPLLGFLFVAVATSLLIGTEHVYLEACERQCTTTGRAVPSNEPTRPSSMSAQLPLPTPRQAFLFCHNPFAAAPHGMQTRLDVLAWPCIQPTQFFKPVTTYRPAAVGSSQPQLSVLHPQDCAPTTQKEVGE